MVLQDAGALRRLLTEVAHSVVFIRRSTSANSMVDIVLLLGRRASSVDSEFVRSVIDSGTTVVSAQVPSFSPERGMVREEWSGAHHQHGVDLLRAGSGLRLRDVVLVTIPEPRTCRLAMLHVWTSPESTYDIDSVRVPWEEVAEYNRKTGRSKKFRVDKLNNPLGKNPTNFWWFSALPGDLQPAERHQARTPLPHRQVPKAARRPVSYTHLTLPTKA